MGMIFKPKYKDQKTGEYKEVAVWHIKYYDGNGTAIRHTTGTKSEKEAKRMLKQKEGRVADGKPVVKRMDRVKITELLQGVVDEYKRNSRASVRDVKGRIN